MQNKNWRNNNQRRNSSQNNGGQNNNNNRNGQRSGYNNNNRNGGGGGGYRPRFDRPRFQQRPPQQREVESPAEVKFFSGMAVDPAPRIYLEKGLAEPTIRAMDLVSPIGKGQRGLIVSPPKSGKTTFLKHITQAITKAEPDMKVYVLLIDERPEEVTDFRRSVGADVRWSTSDQPYENHIRVARELMKEAVAQAAEGAHVMIMIDSLTRLARVHNNATRGHGRTLSGGVDAEGLLIPRKIFGTARNIEGAGSIGILATILVETGSRMDDVIFHEFKGTGNMELVLSREVSDRRIFPAINVRESGTRKEEKLFTPEELKATRVLRSALAGMNDIEAAQALTELIRKYPNNQAIISSLQ
jgi:transcription termination factor Rho